MRKHTPEPWKKSEKADGNWWHIGAGNQAIAAVHAASKKRNEPYASMFEENARRIVACVNACEGIETDRLEQIPKLKQDPLPIWTAYCEKKMQLEDVTEQRDELLEALHDAATSLETIQLRSFGADSFLDDKHSMRAYAGARAAVARESMAKAKGGAVNHFPDAAKMVPGGLWQLVPVVATKAMWAAWDSAPCNNEDDAVNLEAAYSAMLAAAPKLGGE